MTASDEHPVTCAQCGRVADDRLGWSTATGRRGVEWLCPSCTRQHVRSIEGKLDPEWWV